jgi:hypothetical protein
VGRAEESFAAQLRLQAAAEDIALCISACRRVPQRRSCAAGRSRREPADRGVIGGGRGQTIRIQRPDHVLVTHSDDSRVLKDAQVTTYRVLWCRLPRRRDHRFAMS